MSPTQLHARAMTIFVLGIIGIAVCGFAAPVAWMMGISYRSRCLEAGESEQSFGMIGRILGMIGTMVFVATTLLVGAILAVEILFLWLLL